MLRVIHGKLPFPDNYLNKGAAYEFYQSGEEFLPHDNMNALLTPTISIVEVTTVTNQDDIRRNKQ